MKKVIMLIMAVYAFLNCHGIQPLQETLPEVGKKLPPFTWRDVSNYRKKKISLNDFKGKWLFLDFWALTCRTCIESYSKVAALQNEFGNDIQFLFVGKNDRQENKGIEKMYQKMSAAFPSKVIAAFDSVMMDKWRISSVPHIYIIDRQGIVRYITDGRDMTKDKVQRLLNGEAVKFYSKNIDRIPFEPSRVMDNNKIVSASVLTRWNGEKQNSGYSLDGFVSLPPDHQEKGWMVSMVPLYALYNYGYFGKWDWLPYDTTLYGKVASLPILEIKDPTLFQFDYNHDVGKGTYNFFLKIPDKMLTTQNLMYEIQNNLASAFGYLASIESRTLPVWKLIATAAPDHLRTAGGEPILTEDVTGLKVKNCSLSEFLIRLTDRMPDKNNIPYIDYSGIDYKIDIHVDADLSSHLDIKRSLQRNGLDLVLDKKEMKALVIRD